MALPGVRVPLVKVPTALVKALLVMVNFRPMVGVKLGMGNSLGTAKELMDNSEPVMFQAESGLIIALGVF